VAVISSRELADAKSAYLASSQHLEFARVALAREESLWKKKISAEQDYLGAKRTFQESELQKELAAQKLSSLGLDAPSIEGISSAPRDSLPRYEIKAPLSGTVTERSVTVGEAVSADEDIFTIADLSSVWVNVTVYAKDVSAVREGQEATVRSVDLGREATGRITYVGPLVGETTRASTARLVLPNSDGEWRPGLFVSVVLVRKRTTVGIAVAAEAIQSFRDWQVVFVRYGDWFEGRPLELGRSDGEWVEVLSGLSVGEQYAAANSFAVKAEIGKLGATHDH
jgi:cobalt-zinc-cadmium efflux system membrane fusion protein